MDWQDLHVAYTVSQERTVSGAAQVLGVHHATVIRHIDRLEAALGQKLFRRHAKGYDPTDEGQALFNVAAVASEQFLQAQSHLQNRDVEISGKIVITTLPFIGRKLMPAFARFHEKYPDVRIRLESSSRLYRLEFGEAHIAIRAGGRPQDPDNVAVPLFDLDTALYGSRAYTAAHGRFDGQNAQGHKFIGSCDEDARGPNNTWLREQKLRDQIAFDTSDLELQALAIEAGMGLGFVPLDYAKARENLIEHLPTRPEWRSKIWQVTHRDMHRTPKVQAMAECLQETIKENLVDI